MPHLTIFRTFPASRRAGQFVSIAVIVATLAAGPASHAAIEYQILKSFGYPDLAGANQSGPLTQGSDGMLYGTTGPGGPNDFGTVFKIQREGSGYIVLHRFSRAGNDGNYPVGGLVEGIDGALYGTTAGAGNAYAGTVFKLNKDGSGFRSLHEFNGLDGKNPFAALIAGGDGALYGTSYEGGSNNLGTVFKLNKDGSGYSVLHSFRRTGGDGQNPQGSLMQGRDGALYGTTASGGRNGAGTVFKVNKDGSDYGILFSFTAPSAVGQHPAGAVVEGSDGMLYGTSVYGGRNNAGTVFKLNKDGSGYDVLHSFGSTAGDGLNPVGAVMEGDDGALYGMSSQGGSFGPGTVFRINKNGSGYSILHNFGTTDGDGRYPDFGLVEGSDGALYGTTYQGGGAYYEGTVFRLNKDGGDYRILHTQSATGEDGWSPQGKLVEGTDGALYGTTFRGGSDWEGTVFKLTKQGAGYTILKSFSYSDVGGLYSADGLVIGSDGAFYGTTSRGGTNYAGTVFRLNEDGSGYRILRTFGGFTHDGRLPFASLLAATDGALYGTTVEGGSLNAGTLFKINTDASGYSILHSFSGTVGDVRWPYFSLIEGSDGALYGTTYGGSNAVGTVFKFNKDGSGYVVLHSFGEAAGDPRSPLAGLVEGTDGDLYGTTFGGGGDDVGTVFKLSKDGSGFRVLHSFAKAGGDGLQPEAGLVEGSGGALYGTTYRGGSNNVGTIFKIDKDGSGYVVLHGFYISGGDGQNPKATLVRGSDGALYGTTESGGDLGFGTVFRLLANHPPVAMARAFPLVSFSPSDRNGFVISVNNTGASVYFDASQSTDVENDPLQFFWLEEGSSNHFATGVVASYVLSVGSHTIVLVASDGMDQGTNRIVVEVVTAGQAVQKLVQLLNQSALLEKQAHPLLVILNAASDSFDRGNRTAGLNQIKTFLSKLGAQLRPYDPALAAALIEAAQKIIDSFVGSSG